MSPISVSHQGLFPAVAISFNLAPRQLLGNAVAAIRAAEAVAAAGKPDTLTGTFHAFQASLASEPYLIFAALFGALPLAIGHGTGAKLRVPLGIAIAGGLILSQPLTLFTTPVVYLYLDRLARLFECGAGDDDALLESVAETSSRRDGNVSPRVRLILGFFPRRCMVHFRAGAWAMGQCTALLRGHRGTDPRA